MSANESEMGSKRMIFYTNKSILKNAESNGTYLGRSTGFDGDHGHR